jgi:hypothetical protein
LVGAGVVVVLSFWELESWRYSKVSELVVAKLLCGYQPRYMYSYTKSCCLLNLKDSKDSKDVG